MRVRRLRICYVTPCQEKKKKTQFIEKLMLRDHSLRSGTFYTRKSSRSPHASQEILLADICYFQLLNSINTFRIFNFLLIQGENAPRKFSILNSLVKFLNLFSVDLKKHQTTVLLCLVRKVFVCI